MADRPPEAPYEVRRVHENLTDLKFEQMLDFAQEVVDHYTALITDFTTDIEKRVIMAKALLAAARAFVSDYTPAPTPPVT